MKIFTDRIVSAIARRLVVERDGVHAPQDQPLITMDHVVQVPGRHALRLLAATIPNRQMIDKALEHPLVGHHQDASATLYDRSITQGHQGALENLQIAFPRRRAKLRKRYDP